MRLIAAVALCSGICSPLAAQDGEAVPVPEAPAVTELAPCTVGQLPALTPVKLEILDDLGSKISVTGQMFRFRLAEPLVLDGCAMVAAGAEGVGEVVHAKKATGLGAAGEFVAAARYLVVGERQLRLRSLQLTVTGGDRLANASFGAIGGALSPSNKKTPNVEIPTGTLVMAKTAEIFDIVAATSAAEATD